MPLMFKKSNFFSTKTYVVGVQKNHLIEKVPLSTHDNGLKNDNNFILKFFVIWTYESDFVS